MRTLDAGRRGWIARALAAGVALPLIIREALARGQAPDRKGIVRLEGEVRVNGAPAQLGMLVKGGDTLTTGRGASVVFVVGEDAYLLREASRLEIAGSEFLVQALRVVSGKLLSVFGGGARRIETATATIGIRGTGIYIEAEAERTYVCTCYGVADLQARAMPEARETVRTRHHDAPRYIHAHGEMPIKMIEQAPVVNHTDDELVMLEALVGRVPPFVGPGYERRY